MNSTPQAPRRALTKTQKRVLGAAFVPMLVAGGFGAYGTYTNISGAYGQGTALGAVAAGEGTTVVLALTMLGLTMLGQSTPLVIRLGLWVLPGAASVMAAMAGSDGGTTVIYALTPLGMSLSAEGMAFLAGRIVVHQEGRDVEAESKAAAVVAALAYHRARAANHPDARKRKSSERTSWRLARKVGRHDTALGGRLLDVQRDRLTSGADAALAGMYGAPVAPILPALANAEESTDGMMNRSSADQGESTPAAVVLSRLSVPDPLPVDLGKSALDSKTAPALPAPDPGAPVKRSPVVAADSPRPRRVTGRVPESARSPRVRRTPEQLLTEARKLTADWPDKQITGEGLRRALRTSPANARKLRDTLLTERAA